MTDFNPEDVRKVAQGLKDRIFDRDVEAGRNAYNECNYCNARVYWNQPVETIEHAPDCIFLIAKDLLT